ncbi:uncharacterized protein LOC119324534 [Triticum dicoccoides]|uniref:Protein XRI1 n=1 Tax=Triticum turgidum subsp. durum TaxID=4567 RepID=A0A9R0YUT0_TRITD|nr:uncharacterized protein LOC119324534 [Triticum dicoccoides]VAI61301.1 unnamed protein product [Triticum turgidum subsp. durum]
MALQSCHHHDDCRVAPPSLPDWGWEWEWDWEELVRCQLGDAARDGIHGALPALPSLGGGEEESPVSSSEASSGGGGYLEDAVAQWGDRSKRQRTAAAEGPPRCPAMASEDLQCLLQSFWDPSSGEGALLHDLNTMTPAPETSGFLSEEGAASGRGQRQGGEGGRSAAAGQGGGGGEAAAGPPPPFSATAAAPRPPLQKATTGSGSGNYCEPATSSSCSSLAGRRKEGVLYPFAVVKPLVLDGDTLKDVNRRILKRPARPVRHPVGQFACGPVVSSTNRPGLSGKAVVSLTKIRTGGKGTITIIRTRG